MDIYYSNYIMKAITNGHNVRLFHYKAPSLDYLMFKKLQCFHENLWIYGYMDNYLKLY